MVARVACMIGEAGHPAGKPRDPMEEETTMFKTISAALLAVSVLAAPALAASPAKSPTRSTHAPVIKAEPSKSKFFNANARMGRHDHKHLRHHRHHKHMGMLKTHGTPKFVIKHGTHAKRG